LQKDSDGKDIFCHYSAIEMTGYKTIKTGDKVSFVIVDGEKGKQASEVVLISAAPVTAEADKE
jgi:CspA family cold shock protein